MYSAARLYAYAYLVGIFILTWIYYVQLKKIKIPIVKSQGNYSLMVVCAIVYVAIVGLRPTDNPYFGDSVNYAYSFEWMIGDYYEDLEREGEWIWQLFTWWCAQHVSLTIYFLLIETLYVVPVIVACKKLVPNRPELALLFVMTSFSFFSYSYNGIRNGMACSLIILALSLMRGKLWEKIVAGILAFVAFNCHKSTALPILCMIVCLFYGNTKHYVYFWLISIILSLVAGGVVESFFTEMGFDDRMDRYSSKNIIDIADQFNRLGFRWDLLLYSAMPIVLGWYVVFKRGLRDKEYSYLLNSYILCNSFWVMMIRSAYSNRFAYLSWFLYPLVLAYPLLKFPVFESGNNRKVAYILAAHTGFTLFMTLVY